ncbi:hypothetical protein TDB9533_02140 [Thalassocella blandensis]|nr:hypothetical protein TDB9533_02140 [Thalassocella blandensis]
MAISVTAQQIEAQIASDIAACESLISLLDQEQEALKNRDPDQLSEIIDAKLTPLNHLENSANVRAQWLRESGGEVSSDAWLEVLQQTQQQKLKQDWQTLKKLTQQCKLKNEVNGKLLVRNQQVFGRLLEVLRGQNNNSSLYNTKGASKAMGGSNIIGEA